MDVEQGLLRISPSSPGSGGRSMWRWWKRLSRLQRSLVYMAVSILCLYAIYCLPGTRPHDRPQLDVQQRPENALPVNFKPENILPQVPVPFKTNDIPEVQEQNAFLPPPKLVPSKETIALKPVERQVDVVPGNSARVIDDDSIQPPPAEMPETNDLPQLIKFNGPTNMRQRAVVDAFKHAWKGYKQYAWGQDHLKPISMMSHNWFGLGLTLIDALDTMYIMGLEKEFKEARDWVASYLDFNINRDVNLFETTIRVLGGLLSAYHLSGDRVFMEKAVDLGDRLLPCFDTPSGVPYSDVNLATMKAQAPKWSPDSSTSEVTTVQLEFRDLSRITGNPKYENAVARVSQHIHNLPKKDGLVPIFINAVTGQFRAYSTITMGARGDSYYEYLLKQWLQTGKTIDFLRDDFNQSMNSMMKYMGRRTSRNGLLFVGELLGGGKDFKPKMDHLVCYLPGTMALGTRNGMPASHWRFAEELLYTCYQMYAIQPTFLAPEITYFNIQRGATSDMFVKSNDAHNLLRPETLESMWYFYHLTGNKTYQDWGWQIFLAMEKFARVKHGYTSLGSVKNVLDTKPRDMMESFFLGETLKYLYLLFSDDQQQLNLKDYVFNSEAHPLPVYDS